MSTDNPRPQLSRDDLARLQWLLGSLLALLSATTVFFLEVNAWLLVFGITVLAVTGLLRPTWPARVPRWVHRLAFPVMFATLALDLYLTREPLAALIRLDLILILYRLMGYRSRREDLQLIVLGLFLLIVGGVLSVSIAFAAQIVAFAACALLFLFVLTLADAPGGAPPPGEVPAWARARWGDVFHRLRAASDWRIAALFTGLFAGMIVISGLLFMAIPRFEIENSLFLDRLISRKSRSGFSDTIKFGEVTAITQDNSLAVTVDNIDDPGRLPFTPYWRMVVLEDYTGGGFAMSPGGRSTLLGRRPRTRDVPDVAPTETGVSATIFLEAGVSRFLPLLGPYQQLDFETPQSFGTDDRKSIVALQRDPSRMLPYRVTQMVAATTLPDPGFAAALANNPRGRWPAMTLNLAAPDDLDRLQRIVEQLLAGDRNIPVAEFADRATRWLEERHSYSLESTLPAGAGDPLVRWIDSTTPGHCEFFAGALVLLARSAGYPARVVTGFKGGTWNGYSQSFMIRNSNAHAWCELFDASTAQWVRVDPTPGAEAANRIGDEAGEAGRERRIFDTGWLARWESLRVFWYRRIVNFDQESQVELTAAARRLLQSSAERLRTWIDARAEQLHRWISRPWGLDRFARWAGWIGGAVILAWVWRRFGRGRWLRWRSVHVPRRSDPVRREAGRWLSRWHATGATELDPAVQEALERLRYGHQTTWPDPAATFRAAKRALRARGRSRPRSG